MMSRMKNRGDQSQRLAQMEGTQRTRETRSDSVRDPELPELRAFADALRDILREEGARAHG
jgi:hypothetical protein